MAVAIGASIVPIPDHVKEMQEILSHTKRSIDTTLQFLENFDELFAGVPKQERFKIEYEREGRTTAKNEEVERDEQGVKEKKGGEKQEGEEEQEGRT